MNRKICKFYLVLFLFVHCTNPEKAEQNLVLEKIFGKDNIPKRTEFLVRKEIQLNADPNPEIVFIIRNTPEEIVAVFQKTNDSMELLHKTIFSMPHYGPYAYSESQKRWIPEKLNESVKTYIIQKIEFHKMPPDSFYTIFLEILSEEPPLPLFSVPMVFRAGVKIWDGIEELKEKNFLVQNLKSDFIFDESNGIFKIISIRGEIELSFRANSGKLQLETPK